jgi:hypothetical protein
MGTRSSGSAADCGAASTLVATSAHANQNFAISPT